MTLNSKEICALTLSFIALTDIFIVLDIPILRQIFGFVLLTFLPGFLVIQILRVGKAPLEKTLFLIGLSVSFLLWVPFFMNLVLPPLGIARPISLFPLILTFTAILVALSLFAYRTGALDVQIPLSPLNTLIERIQSPPLLAAGLILVFGILGPLFARLQFSTIFSLLSMLSIAAILILIISRRVSERVYPLYILVIAIALLYNRTLASPNLGGIDIHLELYFANLVKSAGFWDPSYSVYNFAIGDYVAMLSVTMLPNVYSILLNLDTVLVFKLVYPIIVAFVPLGLYQIYKTQTKLSNRLAFLATFLFMSFSAFYSDLPVITRQEIGVLFFVLLAVVIMNEGLQESKRAALTMLFISSMAVSHYATSYLFLFYFAVLAIGSALILSKNRQGKRRPLTATMVVFAVAITFGWYTFTSGGAAFTAFINSGNHLVASLTTMFSPLANPETASGVSLNVVGDSFTRRFAHYWQLLTEVLIIIGLALVTRHHRKTPKMSSQLLLLALASFILLLFIILLPAVSASYNTERFYLYALLFLAPCCIFGVEAIVDFTSGRLHVKADTAVRLTSAALIVVLVPFFLFSTGSISEVAERPSNIVFLPSSNRGDPYTVYPNYQAWSFLVPTTTSPADVYGSKWLGAFTDRSLVYADLLTTAEVSSYGNVSPDDIILFRGDVEYIGLHHAYVYLGLMNQYGDLTLYTKAGALERVPIASVPGLTTGTAYKVYSDGLVEVYRYP